MNGLMNMNQRLLNLGDIHIGSNVFCSSTQTSGLNNMQFLSKTDDATVINAKCNKLVMLVL